jgi:uncharacterized protein YdeI (YjbR/CyaY-like superfamily)
VEAAKADGRWEAAYVSQATATVPADLAAALARDEPARAFFESLGRSDRYAVILRLLKARSGASRAAQLRRIGLGRMQGSVVSVSLSRWRRKCGVM